MAATPPVTSVPVPPAPIDLTRAHGPWGAVLETKIARVRQLPVAPMTDLAVLLHAEYLLEQARHLAEHRDDWWSRLGPWWSGRYCDTGFRLAHEAEALRVAAMPDDQRRRKVQEVLFDAAAILDRNDPILQISTDRRGAPTAQDSYELVRRYRRAWDDRYKRSGSYRNRLILLIAVVTVAVGVLVVLGAAGIYSISENLALQFPVELVFEDLGARLGVMVAIATFGSVGGLLAGAGQVVRFGGVYNPMNLPLLALIMKVQMGALCGLAGVLALLGNLLPEVHPQGWGALAAFAMVFGASQQLVTQVIDRKVSALVSSEPRDQAVKK